MSNAVLTMTNKYFLSFVAGVVFATILLIVLYPSNDSRNNKMFGSQQSFIIFGNFASTDECIDYAQQNIVDVVQRKFGTENLFTIVDNNKSFWTTEPNSIKLICRSSSDNELPVEGYIDYSRN